MQRRHVLSKFAAAVLAVSATTMLHAQSRELSFGIISTESTANLKSSWQPLLDDMQKVTGLKINAFFAPDYAGVIEAMRFNKVQVAWMGNKSAMEAVDRAQGEVFAKVTQTDGTEGYYGLMIVHKDSPLKSLDDVLKNRQSLTLGFGDPNSTSGALVPTFYAFNPARVDPTRDFKRTMRANHESNILAVANKQVDVATVASDGVDRMRIKNPQKADELREVWRSPLIASDPLVWRKDLDADSKRRVRDFFLGYGKDARETDILAKLTLGKFLPSTDAQLLPIRQLELARERNKLEADTAMPADEKTRKLGEMDAKLAELGRLVATPR